MKRRNSSMIKKTVIKSIFILLLIVAGILITVNSFGITVEGYGSYCVSDYDEFYLYKKASGRPFLDFGEGHRTTYRIWFSPGQKEKMLNKIKEDVNSELEQIKNDNSNIIKDYSISDDFKTVTIYYVDNKEVYVDWSLINSRIQLYHEISGDRILYYQNRHIIAGEDISSVQLG